MSISLCSVELTVVLATAGTQCGWGSLSSAVSSIDSLFLSGLMNSDSALRKLVFPDADPPETRREALRDERTAWVADPDGDGPRRQSGLSRYL